MDFPTSVLLSAAVMANGEVLHYGKSLGMLSKREMDLLESGACKTAKGGEPIVGIKPEE